MGAESVLLLDTGAAATLLRFRRLGHRTKFWEPKGLPRITTYPGCARSKFGYSRLGEVGCAAGPPVDIAGSRKMRAAFEPEADNPALLR